MPSCEWAGTWGPPANAWGGRIGKRSLKQQDLKGPHRRRETPPSISPLVRPGGGSWDESQREADLKFTLQGSFLEA